MKLFVVVSCLLAVASASTSLLTPGWYGYAPAAAYYAAPAELSSQYHAQDNLGQYSYGYSGSLSAKAETKSLDGVTRGSYTYLDADNKLQTVTYTADAINGFRAQASNLPQAPVETPFAPEPIQDTPEVAKAKADHFNAIEEVKQRNAAAASKKFEESAILLSSAPTLASPIALAPASVFSYSYATSAPVAAFAPAHFSYATYNEAAPAIALPASYTWNHAPAYAYSYGAPAFYSNNLYTAGELPQPVQDTPEVAQAKAEHLQAVVAAKVRALN